MRNLKLKMTLLESGITQKELSQITQINEGLLSLGINGRYIFDAIQRSRIAKALKKPVSELFQIG